jgi:hypothetical protein
MIKIVKAVMRLIETRLRSSGLTGPNSRERVREQITVVLNGRRLK